MCAKEVKGANLEGPKGKRNGRDKAFDPSFLVQLPYKIQYCFKSQLKKFAKDSGAGDLMRRVTGQPAALGVDLDRQLQAWKENPSWVDEALRIKVSVPKGSLCNLNAEVNVGLPPDAVYNIVTDPENKRVFKNIQKMKTKADSVPEVVFRKVLLDEGHRQVVELEQAALWKFLWWSGTISVHVLVDQDRRDLSMKFRQIKSGFMEKFEGCWRVEPLFVDEATCYPFTPKTWADYCSCTSGKGRVGSKVSLEQLIQPAIIPPPPISWYLRGITAKTTEMLVSDLVAEAARIRGDMDTVKSRYEGLCDEQRNNKSSDIKERWALHRRNAKKRHRRLLTAV